MINGIIKNAIMYLIRVIMHIFYLLPIKNRVVFIPINGNFYCNLKYIYKTLAQSEIGNKLYWIVSKKAAGYPGEVKKINLYSLKAFCYILTSRVVIFNSGIFSYIPKREQQVFIETWHGGGAYKCCNNNFKDNPNKYEKKRRYISIKEIDYFIASCGKFIEAMKKDIGDNCNFKFLSIGMPRNDIFFKANKINNITKKIKEKYNINNTTNIVLYAPTFRKNDFVIDINIELVLQELQKKFGGKYVFFIRAHPHIRKNIENNYNSSWFINVSDHPDMQELLCAANVLITDYSSSIWDYSLLKRPCFIYANDLKQYKTERNFHTPIHEWPFPLAQNNDELCNNIKCFNFEQFNKRVAEHLKLLGSYENGTACTALARLILDKCNKVN